MSAGLSQSRLSLLIHDRSMSAMTRHHLRAHTHAPLASSSSQARFTSSLEAVKAVMFTTFSEFRADTEGYE